MKKKIFFITLAVISFSADAQYILRWSVSPSISGGVYPSKPVVIYPSEAGIVSFSNEFFEPSLRSVKGVVRLIDVNGGVVWTTEIGPYSLNNFPIADEHLAGITESGLLADSLQFPFTVAVNVNSSTTRLIQIDANGNIVFNNILNGINRVTRSITDGAGNVFVVGRTPQTVWGSSLCNGIAVAKYNSSGQLVWNNTQYTIGGFITDATDIDLDFAGNVIAAGKKASINSPNDYDAVVFKYSSTGIPLWSRQFTAASTTVSIVQITTNTSATGNPLVFLAYTTTDLVTSGKKATLKKLDAATGAAQWTKTINNAELLGISIDGGDEIILATSIGMRCYNSSGALLWSNGFIVKAGFDGDGKDDSDNYDGDGKTDIVATNVSSTEPLSNFYVKLEVATGAVLYQKNLSFRNHEEYLGGIEGIDGDGDTESYILINDNTPPYGVRLTNLLHCDYALTAFTAYSSVTDVSNTGCNNGQITVNTVGTFNSWPHLELYNSDGSVNSIVDYTGPEFIIGDLPSGTYTLKVFDESCGVQNLNVTVKCSAPSGLSTTNVTRNKAQLNWVLPTCNVGVQLQYRLQGAPTWTTVNTSASYKQLNGLSSNSLYEWRIATKCTGSNPAIYSNYSAIQTFSTLGQQELKQMTQKTIPIEQLPSGMSIYPNPSKGNFRVTVNLGDDNSDNKIIRIININGQVVKQLDVTDPYKLDIQIDKPGLYLVQLISGKNIVIKKLAVIR